MAVPVSSWSEISDFIAKGTLMVFKLEGPDSRADSNKPGLYLAVLIDLMYPAVDRNARPLYLVDVLGGGHGPVTSRVLINKDQILKLFPTVSFGPKAMTAADPRGFLFMTVAHYCASFQKCR